MSAEGQEKRPIGIFDSGVGGLTVLKSIRQCLPTEDFVYLGDTARLPYGTKSPATILRYAQQATRHLQQRGIKLLVVACNTASAVALDGLAAELDPLPVVGVVEPGARAAVAARPAGRHLVLATEATVRLGAYTKAIRRRDPSATVQEVACELLVALAEEGWSTGGIAQAITTRYLKPYVTGPRHLRPDSIILGCTHFPLLAATIRQVVGEDVAIVDSAETTASHVAALLKPGTIAPADPLPEGRLELLATDGATRFARVGGAFLGQELEAEHIHLVDL